MGKTADYYKQNPEAYKKKLAYDKKYNSSEFQKDYRAELGRKNYDKDKKDGKASRNGKHYDHKTGRWIDAKTNQSRPSEKWKKKKLVHPFKRNK